MFVLRFTFDRVDVVFWLYHLNGLAVLVDYSVLFEQARITI
jgi:hypothetical protein